MKKSFLILLILGCVSSLAYGQMDKGSWLLRGNVAFNYGQIEYEVSYNNQLGSYTVLNPSFILSPAIGYFVKDNLAIGVLAGYGRGRSSSKSNTVDLSHSRSFTNTYDLGLFIRKYIPLNDKVFFYLEANGGKGWERPHVQNEAKEKIFYDKIDNYFLNGELGIQYLITKRIGLDLHTNLVQYSSRRIFDFTREQETYRNNELSLSLNSNFGLGASFFF